MSDYSWIKPGVKAVVVSVENCIDSDRLNGKIIDITSTAFFCKGCRCTYRDMNEDGLKVGILCIALRPYKDESKDLVSWESIARDIGVDIRRLETV